MNAGRRQLNRAPNRIEELSHHPQSVNSFLLCLKEGFFLVTFFFFNDTATTEIYTLSLHDALPISTYRRAHGLSAVKSDSRLSAVALKQARAMARSEEHTSELQSRSDLVCRLL